MITPFDLSTGQGKLLFTKHPLLPTCNDPLKPPRHLTSSPAPDVLPARSPFLSLKLWCTGAPIHMYVVNLLFSLAHLPHVCLIIRASRRTLRVEEHLFLSHFYVTQSWFPTLPWTLFINAWICQCASESGVSRNNCDSPGVVWLEKSIPGV